MQVMAFHNTAITTAYVKGYYHLAAVRMVQEGGLDKFLDTKKFDNYMGAHDRREELKNNNRVSDAFVVAYNNGTRITVQEALNICHQQWNP